MSQPSNHTGKVILIGAGPGDPELLTIKALRWLQRADVIITDRLVSPDILTAYTRESALIIPVGKQGHSGSGTAQSTINDLLVRHALQGKLVIRLKGGDISIFSNVLDELQTLVEHSIPYELVPGVTAALGAAAYAGIPLTARGYASAVRLLTSYRQDLLDEAYWTELAGTEDTLVFYMSSEPLDQLISQLLKYGVREDSWVAVIEQATTPQQRVTTFPVHLYPAAAGGNGYASPCLIIIGKVVALQSVFQWLPSAGNGELYFPPVQPPAIPKETAPELSIIPKKKVVC
jgi:uroporphyrin-III C-methyltransferase/precorrin-2 dehydrogenase/sirohydrochlorin ferrochelatase/uroporphyrin-III C-methyltransferase